MKLSGAAAAAAAWWWRWRLPTPTTTGSLSTELDEVLEQAVAELVAMPGGPPAAVVVVQRGSDRELYTAGVTELGTTDVPTVDDHMRAASVAKAFSGATALSLVDDGVLSLEDTIAERLPELPVGVGRRHAAPAAQPHERSAGLLRAGRSWMPSARRSTRPCRPSSC